MSAGQPGVQNTAHKLLANGCCHNDITIASLPLTETTIVSREKWTRTSKVMSLTFREYQTALPGNTGKKKRYMDHRNSDD
jgi:hypothetical protein